MPVAVRDRVAQRHPARRGRLQPRPRVLPERRARHGEPQRVAHDLRAVDHALAHRARDVRLDGCRLRAGERHRDRRDVVPRVGVEQRDERREQLVRRTVGPPGVERVLDDRHGLPLRGAVECGSHLACDGVGGTGRFRQRVFHHSTPASWRSARTCSPRSSAGNRLRWKLFQRSSRIVSSGAIGVSSTSQITSPESMPLST